MGWLRMAAMCVAATVLGGCGVLGGSAAPTVPPSPAPAGVPATSAPAPSPTRAQATATASPAPKPTATAVEAKADTVWVGNTDGEGVYLRKTPVMADRAKPYADGTSLTIVGDDVDGDGQHWKHVKTPDGLEGYVPSIYTVESPP